MFKEQTSQSNNTVKLAKRIARLKVLIKKYQRADITQKTLLDISHFSASVGTTEAFYTSLHHTLKQLVGAENFFIAMHNCATDSIDIPFFADEKDPSPQACYPNETLSDILYSGLTGYVLKTKQALICDQIMFAKLIETGAITARGSQFTQWIGVPIKSADNTTGVLVVQSYHRAAQFNETDITLLTFISHRISAIIERLQYQEQLEQAISHHTKNLHLANQQLKQEISERKKAEQLQKSLYDITALAISDIDSQAFYSAIHHILNKLIPIENCFISLLSDAGDLLSFPYFVSQFDHALPEPRQVSDGLTEYILRHNTPTLLERSDIDSLIKSGQLYHEAPELNHTQSIKQWIGLPLYIHGQVRGSLTIYSYGQSYQKKDLELLTFVSQHIATAIEKKLSTEARQLSYQQLEEKINKRTQALARANRSLQKEIKQRKAVEQKLVHEAKHDNLTGLPNRAMFMDRLSQSIKHIRRHADHKFAVLFIDMDRFKLLNDTLGHLAGDRFLIEIARRLTLCIRSNDMLARLGGDEFVILLDTISTTQDAEDVAERILTILSAPYTLSNQQFNSSASIGLAISGQSHCDTSESMLRHADNAMYQAKSKGKACYVIFNHARKPQLFQELALDCDLESAIKQRQLTVNLLPIVNLSTQNVIALEPQLYWQHPTLGQIKSLQLRNIAEQHNMLIELDNYMLTLLNHHFDTLEQCFGPHLHLQLSISSQHLAHKHAIRALKNSIKLCDFDLTRLTLFFNEKEIIQNPHSHINAFEQLSGAHVKLGIDCYGSAHSAISSLAFLPIHALKLDRSYSDHLESPQHLKLIKVHYSSARALELEVFATGISSEQDCQVLSDIGFTVGQGTALGTVCELDKLSNMNPINNANYV